MSCDSSHAARSLIAGGNDDAAWLNSDIYISVVKLLKLFTM